MTDRLKLAFADSAIALEHRIPQCRDPRTSSQEHWRPVFQASVQLRSCDCMRQIRFDRAIPKAVIHCVPPEMCGPRQAMHGFPRAYIAQKRGGVDATSMANFSEPLRESQRR